MRRSLPGSKIKLLFYGAAAGLAYGLLLRAGLQIFPHNTILPVMSVAFLFVVPFAMGFLSVFFVERGQAQPVWVWLLLPLFPFLGSIVTAMAALWEGWICVVMFAPIGMGLSVVGGIAGGLVARYAKPTQTGNISVACVLALPLLVGPWEHKVFAKQELRRVETVADIKASPAMVWRNIERVRRIHREELAPSWSRRIGFPNPVEATLSFEGAGGVRHATFEGQVLFIETIDVWEPQRRLAFSIHAQTAQIPKTTLDEHVTVGGPLFDVLRGEYVLELLPHGMTRLHLFSQYRVSTDFNWYASWWTDGIMADLQNTILHVIRTRCESEDGVTGAGAIP